MSEPAAPPTYQTIELLVDGPRGELWFNRPEKLNPTSGLLLDEVADAARWLDRRPGLKVVLVSGRGRGFSSGADLDSFGADDEVAPRDAADRFRRTCEALEDLNAVTVARINGACVGGGLVLASACDLRIAVDDAVFFIPEVDLGVPLSGGGLPRLVRELGPTVARELIMTCRRFSAAEALAWRFLNRVVPAAELDAAVEELMASLLDKARQPLLATKRHAAAVAETLVQAGRSWSDADGLLAARADPESREAAGRYLRRRAPGGAASS
ncbi:MAG: enoyl-CoA hydratase/isomerase family protein [Acidimicrobiales bacterium]